MLDCLWDSAWTTIADNDQSTFTCTSNTDNVLVGSRHTSMQSISGSGSVASWESNLQHLLMVAFNMGKFKTFPPWVSLILTFDQRKTTLLSCSFTTGFFHILFPLCLSPPTCQHHHNQHPTLLQTNQFQIYFNNERLDFEKMGYGCFSFHFFPQSFHFDSNFIVFNDFNFVGI